MKHKLTIGLLTIGLLARLWRVDAPIADWHSFRQVDTVSVTKNLIENPASFFIPKYLDLGNLQSGKWNASGYRMVELPILNLLVSIYTKVTNLPIDISSRLLNIAISLVTGLILYKTTRSLYTPFLFYLMPFNIFYNRSTLPENLAVFFLSLDLYFLSKKQYLFANFALALGILIKPYILFLLCPIYIYHFLKTSKKVLFLVWFLLSLVPFFIWRNHISQFPEGIPDYTWLFQKGFADEKYVAFQPYWFRWLFYERLTLLILGPALMVLYIFSLKNIKNLLLFFGVVLYFIFIARGNIQHDYYQVLIVPLLVISLTSIFRKISKPLSLAIVLFSFFLTSKKVLPYYQINRTDQLYASWQADKLLPQDATIIAPNYGDTTFLYYTGRNGYPIEIHDNLSNLQLLHQKLFLLSTNNDYYINNLKNKYTTVKEQKNLIIIDLNNAK